MNKPAAIMASQKGFLLITSYMALSSLMLLSLALWTQTSAHMRGTENALYEMEAFHLAESGLDVAIANLEDDPDYEGVQNVAYTKNNRLIGTYSVTVVTPDAADPMLKQVTATGVTPDLGNNRGVMRRSIVSFVRLRPRQTFDFALFTEQGMGFNGSPSLLVDSYDSNRGPYNSASANSNADVVTNATGDSVVDLDGNVTIKGSVNVGPGGNPSSAITVSSNSTITGTTGTQAVRREYEPAELPSSSVDLGSVSVASGQVLTLASGVYKMSSIQVTGNGSIQATGPVEIYLTGEGDVGGNGVITASNRPENMLIHVVGSGSFKYSGNGSLYGAIYAPDSHVTVTGNGSIYGAVIADTYKQSGKGEFHFDEDLKQRNEEVRLRSEVVSWREMNKFLG